MNFLFLLEKFASLYKQHDTISSTMAKRRTKKDKLIAQLRRQVNQQQYETPEDVFSYEPEMKKGKRKQKRIEELKKSNSAISSLFSYDPTLIRKDLLRTVVLSALAFAIEFGLYFIWR